MDIKNIKNSAMNYVRNLSEKVNAAKGRDEKDNTALHYAAKNSDHEMVELLIKQRKVNLDASNKNGQTPLTLAIGNCTIGVNEDKLLTVDTLLRAGAEIDKAEYKTMLHVIRSNQNKNKYSSLCQKIEKSLVLMPFLSNHFSSENIERESGNNNHSYDERIYEEISEPLYNTPEYGNSISSDKVHTYDIPAQESPKENYKRSAEQKPSIPQKPLIAQKSPIPGKTKRLIAMFEKNSKPKADSKPSKSIPNAKILSCEKSIEKASDKKIGL